MALRNVPYAAQTNPTMGELDQTFADVAALGVVPCTASGTNSITLTPNANTPTISAYANYNIFSFVAAATSTSAVTLQVGSLGFLNVYLSDGVTQAGNNSLTNGIFYLAAFNQALNSGAGGFQITVTTGVTAITNASNGGLSFSSSVGSIIANIKPSDLLVKAIPTTADSFLIMDAAAGNVAKTATGASVGSGAKAWVNFTVSGAAVTINTALNAAVARNGTGDFTVSFASFVSANSYVWSLAAGDGVGASGTTVMVGSGPLTNNPTASSFRFGTSITGTPSDPGFCSAIFFGN